MPTRVIELQHKKALLIKKYICNSSTLFVICNSGGPRGHGWWIPTEKYICNSGGPRGPGWCGWFGVGGWFGVVGFVNFRSELRAELVEGKQI